jgi:hypothetical protein
MRKRKVIAGVFLLMFGLLGVFRMLSNPRVQALHGSDVLALMAPGLCFGVGLPLLLGRLMFRGE